MHYGLIPSGETRVYHDCTVRNHDSLYYALVWQILQLQVVQLVGPAVPEIQLCSFSLHCSLLRVFGVFPSCNAERCIKSKFPSWRGKRLSVRAVKDAGIAFIGTKRNPLTEEEDGSGACSAKEGSESAIFPSRFAVQVHRSCSRCWVHSGLVEEVELPAVGKYTYQRVR
jgi:hypothetical protein